ncbi:MAG: MFS transporter [bacterium]|nr:MFS transporter [bacterium]
MTTDLKPSQQTTPPTNLWSRITVGLSEYRSSVGLFSRNARLYLIGSFLIGINFSVFNLLFNLYLKELGFVESQIGFVNSSRAVGMTLVAIPAAMILSRIRLKPLLLAACVCFAVFSFGQTTIQQMSLLLGVAVLTGMSFAFFRIASGPFYMRNSTRTERTHLFSFSFGMHLLAGIIGSWGAGHLVTVIGERTGDIILGYQYTLLIAIAMGLMALVPFGLVKASLPSSEENRITLNLAQFKRRGTFYFKVTFVNFLIGTGAGLIIPFMNLYFRDRFLLPPDRIGLYFILLSFGMLVGTLCGPLLTRRLGLVRTIVITQLASIPFMMTLAYSYALILVVPAFVIRGGLMNLGVPISTNFGMELSEKKEQGLVNALLSVSWTSSWMVSVAIGGSLIEHYGYTVVLNIASSLYLLSSLSYFWFFGRIEKRNSNGPGWYVPRDIQL